VYTPIGRQTRLATDLIRAAGHSFHQEVEVTLEVVVKQLAKRYAARPVSPVATRRKGSALDAYLIYMRRFTLRRVYAKNPRQYSLRRLAREINIELKSDRRYSADAVKDSLIRHKLYQLWK
jgi:hypothetical protein